MKRLFDLTVSFALLVLLSPLLLALWITGLISLGRPVLFRQTRPGEGGNLFLLYKFRTMREAGDEAGEPLPDQERLTRYGRFLRSTSLDELPTLLNVLRGDMSLVGPRPLLTEYLLLYNRQQARRHDVKPGITGWAQINGRNTLTWEEKFEYDIWYVENRSFWLDLKILFWTLVRVVRREGISARGHETMPKFEGTSEDSQKKQQ